MARTARSRRRTANWNAGAGGCSRRRDVNSTVSRTDAREGKPPRSLLNHREGLSVFLDRPDVPMDNNFSERMLRGAAIGRRLSFGSDSEAGARFHGNDVLHGRHPGH